MTDWVPAAFIPAAVDACAMYRQFIPHINLPKSKFMFRLGALDVREMEGVKVAIVQRQVSDINMIAMRRMKEVGIKVVYDLDDDIWSLPDWNPGKATFDAAQAGFLMCASEANLITVSTKGLENAARKGFKLPTEIVVVPNSIDLTLFQPKTIVKNDNVIIGWGGSNTHSEDVKDVFDIIPAVLDENPIARMEIAGAAAVEYRYEFDDEFRNGMHVKVRKKMAYPSKISLHKHSQYRPWVPIGEYPNRLSGWGWDIAIAPLMECKFNRSKSCIKMLEAAALKIPCLASDVQPYNEFASLGGPDLKWLLCSFPFQWQQKLKILINEPERRKYLGEKMYELAKKWFNAETVAQNWNYAFQRALEA